MNRSTMTVLAAAIGLSLGATALAEKMTKPDYKNAKKAIEADYKGLKAGCDPLTANAKDICIAEAKGKEQVALADLEANYKPSDKTRYEARLAKAKAIFAVAKEKCDDKADNAKDVCVKEADAAYTAAKADAKAHRKTVEANKTAAEKTVKAKDVASDKVAAANKDASADKRAADYAVAKEKCDALAGNPKEACMADAKARFGKS